MAHADIRAVNLNLLAAFDALLEERNVTRAAGKMGVTQSAMSSSLAQLRVLFDDPLFRRTPRGIEPTPRALELGDPIRRGLGLFDRALTPRSFDPASESRVFVLATSDYVEFVLLPPLLKRLAREAPGVRLEVRPWGLHHVPKTLHSGEVDLMIGFYDEVPAHHAASNPRRARSSWAIQSAAASGCSIARWLRAASSRAARAACSCWRPVTTWSSCSCHHS